MTGCMRQERQEMSEDRKYKITLKTRSIIFRKKVRLIYSKKISEITTHSLFTGRE